MKKLILLLLLAGIFLTTNVFAQDHVIVSEFVVDPTEGEFIEIYNPTSDSVDLSHHYVTDDIGGNNNAYTTIVQAGYEVGSSSDFMVKFPDGTKIGPGQHMTVAFSGTGFTATYLVPADFEIKSDDAATADMDSISLGTSAFMGLSNSGEVIIVFYWDGISDLVKDVDIVVWGDQNEAVDKTGLSIDGIDADTDASTYADDTPKADQFVVNTENDDDANPHDPGSSAQRRLDVEDVEDWSANGNGLTGHDETGENTSWKGGIWSINEPATPGERALGGGYTLQADGTLLPDSLTISDVNFVREDSIRGIDGISAFEDSPFLGDTLTVTGIITHDIRDIFFGPRFGVTITDGHGGPWSNMLLFQDDSTVATNITDFEPGDKVRITGVATEFPAAGISLTEFSVQLDPVVPIVLIDVAQPLPEPVLLTPGDIGAMAQTADAALSERWEMVLVRFENLTITANGLPGGLLTAEDETGEIALDDFFNAIFDTLVNNVWPGLPPGALINVTGYVRGGTSLATVTIAPRNYDDIEIASAPPDIVNVGRDPAAPTSSESVTVSADITDLDGTIATASVMYSVDDGAFQTVAMTVAANDTTYSGDIPAQVDGAFVKYFVESTDNDANKSITPADTTAGMFFYIVRDAGLTIRDVQETPFSDGNSGFVGAVVTLTGAVTSIKDYFSDRFISDSYYIQDDEAQWSGIQVHDPANSPALGDTVTVTGTVEENFNLTRLASITSFTINSSGNPAPSPLVSTTGEMGTAGANPEAFESVLVEVQNVTVSVPFPDGTANFGEFSVTDGSGDLRIDDENPHSFSQTDTMWTGGETITFISGIHHFHNGNYKIQPRTEADLGDFTVNVDENEGIPTAFSLAQNYPNPFNPETTVRYQLAAPSDVTIHIYNILGQRVKTLVDAFQPTGAYSVQWRGTNDRGLPVATGVYIYHMKASDFVQVKKMLFLK